MFTIVLTSHFANLRLEEKTYKGKVNRMRFQNCVNLKKKREKIVLMSHSIFRRASNRSDV